MAGSVGHCIDDETDDYIGVGLLDHMGDASEAVNQMMFVIKSTLTKEQREAAIAHYYRCARGEEAFPPWYQPDDGE